MTGGRIDVKFDSGSIRAGFAGLQKLGHDTRPAMTAIGHGLVETTSRRFESGTDPEGKAWQKWSPAYAKVTTSRSILRSQSGNSGLMGSLTSEADARSVRVGSNKVYAAVHQFGATIVPKNAKSLRFMLGSRVVFAKKVTIPARPYLGFGPKDRQVVHDEVSRVLRLALAARNGR
jgi:phage virion morphogenesis protein